ncbi:MAG TPA: hypothetical protein VN661_09805 [Candidatus Acidoferrales bacterium]|nr:hypothetical protein [Candidatus Acidoferrales bacterium]
MESANRFYRRGAILAPALAVALALGALGTAAFGQDNSKTQQPQQNQQNQQNQNQQQNQKQQNQQNQSGTITPAIPQQATTAAKPQAPAPKVDPAEEAAYKALAGMPTDTTDGVNKQIVAGKDFLQKYPTSGYRVAVYNQLVNDYYKNQDWTNFYAAGDKAVELDKTDLDVLVLVGWLIPHSYNPTDLDAQQKLQKSEDYERRALAIIPTLVKPPNMTDQQFTDQKNAAESQAHSGLGLTLFRKQDFANSATELKQATGVAQPDPTDLYVLGIDYDQLKQYAQAEDAYDKCGAIAGSLQTSCKQHADKDKALATKGGQPAPAPHN